jgi:hypothetical protein
MTLASVLKIVTRHAMGGPLFLGTGKTTYANIASCKIARKSTSTSGSFSEDLVHTSEATERIPVTDVNPTRAFITLSSLLEERKT